MKKMALTRVGLGALLVLVAACETDRTSPVAPSVESSMALFQGTTEIEVCKLAYNVSFTFGGDDGTLGQSFEFTATATGGTVLGPLTLTAQNYNVFDQALCGTIWVNPGVAFDDQTVVTVTEVPKPGFRLKRIAFWGNYPPATIEDPASNSVSFKPMDGMRVFFKNVKDETPPPPPPLLGRMTGGGNQITVQGVRISRGFTIHCDITLSNNVEVNWKGGNKWHIDKPLTSATCIDDPAVDPTPPPAPFDTFIGEAYGRLNNVDGSFIRFTFVDAGEPSNGDHAIINIWAPGANPAVDPPVLSVDGVLDSGNIQAHYDQPHK